jgi:hypothetical protein
MEIVPLLEESLAPLPSSRDPPVDAELAPACIRIIPAVAAEPVLKITSPLAPSSEEPEFT